MNRYSPTDVVFPIFDDDKHEDILACPVCHEEGGLHIDSVVVLTGNGRGMRLKSGGEDEHNGVDAVTLDADECQELAALAGHFSGPGGGVGRRHVVILEGDCEQNHRFQVHFRQAKGTTYIKVLNLGGYTPDWMTAPPLAEDLWP
jgi:hypothetical protein